jgi:hypothetical protein
MDEVFLDDPLHVFGLYAGVPDIVRKNENYRPHFVAAGAGVAQDSSRREAQASDLLAESLK